MIISLRGTNGSGKSHLVFSLMKQLTTYTEGLNKRGKPDNYRLLLPNGEPLYIVGSYANACGGCDGIQPYDDIWPRVDEFAQKGHVLFEGSLVSSGYGRIGEASEKYGDNVVFAFMDTPVDQCIKHVEARRKNKGNTKQFNPKNLIQKYRAVELSIKNIRDNHERRIVMVPYQRATETIIKLLLSNPLKRNKK